MAAKMNFKVRMHHNQKEKPVKSGGAIVAKATAFAVFIQLKHMSKYCLFLSLPLPSDYTSSSSSRKKILLTRTERGQPEQ